MFQYLYIKFKTKIFHIFHMVIWGKKFLESKMLTVFGNKQSPIIKHL